MIGIGLMAMPIANGSTSLMPWPMSGERTTNGHPCRGPAAPVILHPCPLPAPPTSSARSPTVTSGCTSRASAGTAPDTPVHVIARGEGCALWDATGHRLLDGLVGSVHRAGRSRPSRPRRGRGAPGRDARLLPALDVRAPAGDRAGGPSRHARARRPEPGVLHHRRFRSGRVGVEAGPPVLPRRRPGTAPQGDRPAHRVPRHHAGRARDHRRARAAHAVRAARRPAACHVSNTNRRGTRSATTRRRSCSRSPTRSRSAIVFEGPETVAAVFLEPVQNAGGCLVPPDGYFQRVREICDRYGVLLVSDEVICAFGRLGDDVRLRALRLPARHHHLRQGTHQRLLAARRGDLSRLPRRAVPRGQGIVRPRPHLRRSSGELRGRRSRTSTCSSRGACSSNVRGHEAGFRERLERLRDLPIVGDVRGAGYFQALEMVPDQASDAQFDAEQREELLRGFLLAPLLRAGPHLPRRRPRRSRGPARAAARRR